MEMTMTGVNAVSLFDFSFTFDSSLLFVIMEIKWKWVMFHIMDGLLQLTISAM